MTDVHLMLRGLERETGGCSYGPELRAPPGEIMRQSGPCGGRHRVWGNALGNTPPTVVAGFGGLQTRRQIASCGVIGRLLDAAVAGMQAGQRGEVRPGAVVATAICPLRRTAGRTRRSATAPPWMSPRSQQAQSVAAVS